MVRFDKRSAQKGARHVDDRRGRGGGASVGKVGGGIGGILALVLALVFGGDVLGSGGSGGGLPGFEITAPGFDSGQVTSDGATGADIPDPDADTVEFMQFLMYDIQEVWRDYFGQAAGGQYQETTLVIFENAVSTGCGNATSAVGPFYCPAPGDQQVYIDLAFWNELDRRFGAPGDFAQAYVVAHEVGHHIQTISGISPQVRQAQAQNPDRKNELSVRQELQADCFAGIWAHSAAQRTTDAGLPLIEPGDIDEGLAAAAAVGDDRIAAQAGMSIDPHTWTHGSAAARQYWFTKGFESGDPNQCDTFAADSSEINR